MITNAHVDEQEDRPPGHLNSSSDTWVLPQRNPPPNPRICDTHHNPHQQTQTPTSY